MYMKYKKYSYEEFKKLTTEIILTDDYADYNYYAVYLPNRKKLQYILNIHITEIITILMIV